MPVLMTTVAETTSIDCLFMGDSFGLALQGETPRELSSSARRPAAMPLQAVDLDKPWTSKGGGSGRL
jgi:hypothetical protein